MLYSHVLITRPGPQATDLADAVSRMGMVPLQARVFQFMPGFPGLDFNLAWKRGDRQLAIFSSTRAVEFGLRHLPAGFLEDTEIAAIGPATADALEAAGYTVSIIPENGYNSEALLGHPALCENAGTAIIFAAPGGRQALFEGLQELGWHVSFAHVYRAVPLEAGEDIERAIAESSSLLSVWTSANALKQLFSSLGETARDKVSQGDFLVTSERLAEIAGDYSQARVYVTDGPGNEAIERRILQLI